MSLSSIQKTLNSTQSQESILQDCHSDSHKCQADYYVRSEAEGFDFRFNDRSHSYFPLTASAGDYTVGSSGETMTAVEKNHASQGVSYPVTTFNQSTGTVDIKILKPGLTTKQVRDNIFPFSACDKLSAVEVGFDASYNGNRYFLTVTKTSFGYYPTVTKIDESESTSDVFCLKWKSVDKSEAEAFLRANKDRLKEEIKNHNLDWSFDDYLEKLISNLGNVKSVYGVQKYNARTGEYQYQQNVDLGWFANAVSRHFGANQIIGAALKISYHAIEESAVAGRKGSRGQTVKAMTGANGSQPVVESIQIPG